MALVRKVRRRSNGVGLTIPKPIADALGWTAGTSVDIELAGNGIIVRTGRQPPPESRP